MFDGRRRAVADSAILVRGDACGLVHAFRDGARAAGISVVERADGGGLSVVVLAIETDPSHSAFTKAAQTLNALGTAVTTDALSIVVVCKRRPHELRPRLRRMLAREIMFQIAFARTAGRRRTIFQRIEHGMLEGAGLQFVRLR